MQPKTRIAFDVASALAVLTGSAIAVLYRTGWSDWIDIIFGPLVVGFLIIPGLLKAKQSGGAADGNSTNPPAPADAEARSQTTASRRPFAFAAIAIYGWVCSRVVLEPTVGLHWLTLGALLYVTPRFHNLLQ